jgi:hypothetical protein
MTYIIFFFFFQAQQNENGSIQHYLQKYQKLLKTLILTLRSTIPKALWMIHRSNLINKDQINDSIKINVRIKK